VPDPKSFFAAFSFLSVVALHLNGSSSLCGFSLTLVAKVWETLKERGLNCTFLISRRVNCQ
jgi:hypothetical protein